MDWDMSVGWPADSQPQLQLGTLGPADELNEIGKQSLVTPSKCWSWLLDGCRRYLLKQERLGEQQFVNKRGLTAVDKFNI